MSKLNFEDIFSDSLDTFKVFDDLNLQVVNNILPNTPKNIWQILNHLIAWHQYQIEILRGQEPLQNIAEAETWAENDNIMDLRLVNSAVTAFKGQINNIKAVISMLTIETPDIQAKLKCIQDITTHLSFHLGEVILIRRQLKNYPLPDEMRAFLSGK
ncbi:MAG: hypothetical protein JWP78_958 [Mucilaginibacter sp.]|nr:hypothetical protein [Mucilaginibacter sp.]